MPKDTSMGPAIVWKRHQIAKMLRLAKASEDDAFYDLGAGYGQNLIVAVEDFNLKKAVGIEDSTWRVRIARKRIRKRGLTDRITIIEGRILNADISEATIAYFGLYENTWYLRKFQKSFNDGTRLITLYRPIFSVIPDGKDYPFYLTKFPCKTAKNFTEWIDSFIPTPNLSSGSIYEEMADYLFYDSASDMKRALRPWFKSL